MKRWCILLLTLLSCITLSGCQASEEKKVEEVIVETLDRMTVVSEPEVDTIVSTETSMVVNQKNIISQTILSKADYNVDKVEINDNQAKAILVVSSPDILLLLEECADKATTTEDIFVLLEESLNGDYSEKEYKVEVNLEQNEEKWEVITNTELMNALYGGLIEEGQRIITEVLNNLAGGGNESE